MITKPRAAAVRRVATFVVAPEKILHALSGKPLTNKELRTMLGYPPGAAGPLYRDQDIGKVFGAVLDQLRLEKKVESVRIGRGSKYQLTATGVEALKKHIETLPPTRIP